MLETAATISVIARPPGVAPGADVERPPQRLLKGVVRPDGVAGAGGGRQRGGDGNG